MTVWFRASAVLSLVAAAGCTGMAGSMTLLQDAGLVQLPDGGYSRPDGGAVDVMFLADGGISVVDREPYRDPIQGPGVISVVAGKDSAVLTIPQFAAAQDYRAYPSTAKTRITDDGRTEVLDTTIHCAGLRQRSENKKNLPNTVLQKIELTGLTGPTEFVVEAIDRLCPFPGMFGKVHGELPMNNIANDVSDTLIGNYPVLTEAEIRATHKSMIINGQGNQVIGKPSPHNPPKALARWRVTVTPQNVVPPVTKFFDDFSDPNDQPVLKGDRVAKDVHREQQVREWQNSKWSFVSSNIDSAPNTTQVFIDRGQLRTLLADKEQDVFSEMIAMPRSNPVKLDDNGYLHVTWEVHTVSTARRYWWMFLCGAETAGQSWDAGSGFPTKDFLQTQFFYDNDGRNPSLGGWNCFQLFPRGGSSFKADPDNTRPESDLRVMVNLPRTDRQSVINVSPLQLPVEGSGNWYRQQKGQALTGVMLDDKWHHAPKVRFDLYLKRDRAVLYVDQQQRLCNNFAEKRSPDGGVHPRSPKLTMAEGVLGLGHVLYHSTAEYYELTESSFWIRDGMKNILENTPWADERAWDNMGYDENVQLPSGFDQSACYSHQ